MQPWRVSALHKVRYDGKWTGIRPGDTRTNRYGSTGDAHGLILDTYSSLSLMITRHLLESRADWL
jgi:hypothetical protein